MSLELEELYQEVILDHSRRPRNFGDLADAAVRVHGDNPACGAEAPRTLGDLRMMQGVRKFPQRVKCAMLAWRAVEQALLQSAGEATISTETDFTVPAKAGMG